MPPHQFYYFFSIPDQITYVGISLFPLCFFFIHLIVPNLARVLTRHIHIYFHHFHFALSESSSKCRRPKINCCPMCDRECARNRYQTQSSASKILLRTLIRVLRFIRILHKQNKKSANAGIGISIRVLFF